MNMSLVTVTPKSSKAKNRLANTMDGNSLCRVEQRVDGKVFLASANRKYFFWVNELSPDPHWNILH
jgi:hypothetical protein